MNDSVFKFSILIFLGYLCAIQTAIFLNMPIQPTMGELINAHPDKKKDILMRANIVGITQTLDVKIEE